MLTVSVPKLHDFLFVEAGSHLSLFRSLNNPVKGFWMLSHASGRREGLSTHIHVIFREAKKREDNLGD